MKFFRFGFAVYLSCAGVNAADYPVEFTDFFTPKRESVLVFLAGDSIGQRVDALVSYESFRLLDSGGGNELLRGYLSSNKLSSGAVDKILNSLNEGVPSNSGCDNSLNTCQPEVSGDQASYVFDIDSGKLIIYVGSQLLAGGVGDIEYHAAQRGSNALVNQARLYSYADGAGNSGLNASNLTTIGLPYGFFQFNTQYQNQAEQFDVYKGVYDLEVGGARAVFGYTERDRVQFNSTDFLNDGFDYAAFSAQIGSSRNLVKGGSSSIQNIDFFAPQSGQLEVYQGDRLLLSQVVSQGRQSIAYSDLPHGTYEISLVLKAGGVVILEERRQVANTQVFNLPVGAWDYVLTAGRLANIAAEDELTWLRASERFSAGFGQVRTSFRAMDSLLLAGAVTSNQDDWYAQVGINAAWRDWLQGSYQLGKFSSEDSFQSGSLSIGSLYLSAQRYELDKSNRLYRLSSALYGESAYFNYSAMYSTQLGDGNGYIAYSHYESESPYTQTELMLNRGNNISIGWTVPLFGGSLGLNTTYSDLGARGDNDFSAGMYWSYSFDSDWSSRASFSSDRTGLSRSDIGVTRNMRMGRWSGAATAVTAWQRDLDNDSSLSGVVSGSTDWFDASLYGYTSNSGQHIASGSFSGSQFLSLQGGGFSNDSSSSFINVEPDIKTSPNGDSVTLEDIHYNIRRGKGAAYQGYLGQSSSVIALTPYTDTEFTMDAEAKSIDIEQPSRREFVYPGTVYTINSRITPLVSQLFVLSDLQGQPISQVRCVGDGCQSVERLSDDGVFRVNYRQGAEVSLFSKDRACINSPELMRGNVVYSYCLPGLEENGERIALSLKKSLRDSELLYLGKYPKDTAMAGGMLDKIKQVGLSTYSVEVGHNLYIYVKYNKQYTVAQRTLLEGLDAYVVLNEVDVNRLFSAR